MTVQSTLILNYMHRISHALDHNLDSPSLELQDYDLDGHGQACNIYVVKYCNFPVFLNSRVS